MSPLGTISIVQSLPNSLSLPLLWI
jgi:hypothetical protein